jgi:quercetin dioxygenase-like cupin family protein
MRSAKFWLAVFLIAVVGTAAVASFARLRVSFQTSRPESQERARVTFSTPLPKLDGANLKATLVEVRYGPGESSAPHTHPCPVIGYVLQGAIRTQINSEAEATYRPGESFYEPPGSLHQISANASTTEPAKFIAFFLCDHDAPLSIETPATGRQKGD